MQLGKTLVGAIIGAGLGIGLLVGAFLIFHLDAVWLSIPVAALTGLGVRMLVSTSGHASYLRGAITVILALAAYLGGVAVQKNVVNSRDASHSAAIAKSAETVTAETPEEPADATPPPEPAKEAPAPARVGGGNSQRGMGQQQGFNLLDGAWLFIAALVAYELGRGSDPKGAVVGGTAPTEPGPAGTHPDA